MVRKYGILALMIVALIVLIILQHHLKEQIDSIENKVETMDAPLNEVEECIAVVEAGGTKEEQAAACDPIFDIDLDTLPDLEF